MRIAIYHNLPSGGAKRALYEFVKGSGEEHEYDLYRLNDPENEEYLDLRPLVKNTYDFDFVPFRIPQILKGIRALEPIVNLRRMVELQQSIAKQIDERNYDLVFVHHCRLTQTPAIITYLKTPVLYYMQEPRRISFEESFKVKFPKVRGPLSLIRSSQQRYIENKTKQIDYQSARLAALILCNSYFSLESIARAYGQDARVSYLGINTEQFGLSKQPRNANVISVGALHPAKGHDFIIRSLGTIPQEMRPALNIVYDRELSGYADELTAAAEAVGVKLRLHHRVSETELVKLYQEASAALCAAHLEPFGFTPLEAMSCGTPVVAVREGGYRETVADEVGLLTDRVEKNFGKAVQKILVEEMKYNPNDLRRLVEDNWSWAQANVRLSSFYEQVAKR